MHSPILNSKFDKIKTLTWYPYTGLNYESQTDAKFLLVGESHYAQDSKGNYSAKKYQEMIQNKLETIDVLHQAIKNNGEWKFFKNTHKAIIGENLFDIKHFWSNVAFMNFIQKPMKTNLGRPNSKDYEDGWINFIETLKVLQPSHCIFLGSGAANHLSKIIKQSANLSYEITLNHKKIGAYYGKKVSLTIDNHTTNITFIKHPSSYFKWKLWYDYLTTRNGEAIKKLRERILKA